MKAKKEPGSSALSKAMIKLDAWQALAKAMVKTDKSGRAILEPEEAAELLRLSIKRDVHWPLSRKWAKNLKADEGAPKVTNADVIAECCDSILQTALGYDTNLLGALRDATPKGGSIKDTLKTAVSAAVADQDEKIKAEVEARAKRNNESGQPEMY